MALPDTSELPCLHHDGEREEEENMVESDFEFSVDKYRRNTMPKYI